MSFLIIGYKLTLDYNIKHKYILIHPIIISGGTCQKLNRIKKRKKKKRK